MGDAFVGDLFSVFDEEADEKPLGVPAPRQKKTPTKRPYGCEETGSAASEGGAAADGIDDLISRKRLKLERNITFEQNLTQLMPRVKTVRVETLEGCTHEVAIGQESAYETLKPRVGLPAKEYPFLLDPFQREAILCIDNSQSVLVAAHTSAGKTVCAEYAIAQALRGKQRVIFTSPIKALSNQKYRELHEEFHDVGLLTGDITINPSASCLVMTTEILRSMLYRGSEIMREVAWVIFDEIHYMRNPERGVVWEETIILLPDNVHYVFLSATIPNGTQFAEWICHLHKQPCHVVSTDYRPTPLQHFIFPAGGDGLLLVVDEFRDFKEDNFLQAMSQLREGGDPSRKRKGGNKGESNVFKIIKLIMERNLQPVIIFSFSKRECETYAVQLSQLDFNTEEEKCLVEEVFNNAMSCLSDEDQKLPQVQRVLPILKRGIGIHHGGLLPVLKETIEILFSEGLIKALFATETFAMGINMPARTVLFTSARKFDGRDHRWISSGEYIQMSGRAGRRGMDERGTVILMVDEKMSPTVGHQLLQGSPDPLNSAFHLTYNMVLNLLRVEEINPEYMLEKSFFQFQQYKAVPDLLAKLQTLQGRYATLAVPDQASATSYYHIEQQLQRLHAEARAITLRPQHCLHVLQPGRLVQVTHGKEHFGWGVVVNFQRKPTSQEEFTHVVEALLLCSEESVRNAATETPRPPQPKERGELQVVPVALELVEAISTVRLYMPPDLRTPEARHHVLKTLQEVKARFPDGVPLMDPVHDLGIKDPELEAVLHKTRAFAQRRLAHPLHTSPQRDAIRGICVSKAQVAEEMRAVRKEVRRAHMMLQMDELKRRKRVLRRLGYCTQADVIQVKGRVACEITAGHELLLTELVFEGIFNELSPEQAAALLSCFVFQEKASETPKLATDLAEPLRKMKECARRIGHVSVEAKLLGREDALLDDIRPQLMDVVYSWALGESFFTITTMTDAFEGSIIRCFRRLEELLKEMGKAAHVIGNSELEEKFNKAVTAIKRDIVFAGSLYL